MIQDRVLEGSLTDGKYPLGNPRKRPNVRLAWSSTFHEASDLPNSRQTDELR